MSSFKTRSRGRPLVVLLAVLGMWIGARAVLWESPFAAALAQANLAVEAVPMNSQVDVSGQTAPEKDGADPAVQPGLLPELRDRPTPWLRPLTGQSLDSAQSIAGDGVDTASVGRFSANSRAAGAHQMMFLAAMAHLPVPQDVEDRMVHAAEVGQLPPARAPRQDRWSVDAWALWRDGSGVTAISQGRVPTYGASQAGAVLRYRLAPQDGRDPRVYLRAYRALVSRGESELAPGVSARPLANLPLRAHAELRVTDRTTGTDLRPAAMLTTELAPHRLPAGMRAEMYVQGGYAGGKFATAFADGQLHVLRDVERFDLGRLSMGAGLWAGAQKGAARTDVGPTMRLDLDIGHVPARLAVDYRARVAGDAEPASCAAVTLSTRF